MKYLYRYLQPSTHRKGQAHGCQKLGRPRLCRPHALLEYFLSFSKRRKKERYLTHQPRIRVLPYCAYYTHAKHSRTGWLWESLIVILSCNGSSDIAPFQRALGRRVISFPVFSTVRKCPLVPNFTIFQAMAKTGVSSILGRRN